MSNLVEDIKHQTETVAKRILNDIEDTTRALEEHRAELKPLLPILKAIGSDLYPGAMALMDSALPPTPIFEEGDIPEETPPPSPRSWSQYKLPPRHRKFLDDFGHKDSFLKGDLNRWYKRRVNPNIQEHSLNAGTSNILRVLANKGIIEPHGTKFGCWVFLR